MYLPGYQLPVTTSKGTVHWLFSFHFITALDQCSYFLDTLLFLVVAGFQACLNTTCLFLAWSIRCAHAQASLRH
jgi:hypothetical protein